MIDKEVMIKKLQELEQYTRELEKMKALSLKEIQISLPKSWSIEHGLQLAIQLVIDIGNHILAAIGENRIDEYADVIDRLGERQIIPPDFAKEIRDMAGFRNVLVHEYIDVDLKQVYYVLQNRLSDFQRFNHYIKNYLYETP